MLDSDTFFFSISAFQCFVVVIVAFFGTATSSFVKHTICENTVILISACRAPNKMTKKYLMKWEKPTTEHRIITVIIITSKPTHADRKMWCGKAHPNIYKIRTEQNRNGKTKPFWCDNKRIWQNQTRIVFYESPLRRTTICVRVLCSFRTVWI